jgi:hypothetical protein
MQHFYKDGGGRRVAGKRAEKCGLTIRGSDDPTGVAMAFLRGRRAFRIRATWMAHADAGDTR